ncbi:hypothetical protein Pla123a_08150 [Posidoniimonas polymericola]|uniref:Periplasmic lipoprotein n=1 Tax=Posidoniimonas polymericola TaxID=2528002 RepID=A0A5C5ZG29_9BACT|nr:DUF2291 family protein [Posidoniimonas polymericola]TWT86007.1 hypothetical protein Pla123a_08150 [Posidoniimonas polymericola]
MNRAAAYRWTFIAAAAALGCWFVPLVHVRPLGANEPDPADQPATAAELAEQFWSGPLAGSHDRAHPADEVLSALADNLDAAKDEYGRTVGVSRAFLLYLRGEGTVTAVERKGVLIDIDGDSEADLLLETGPIFGAAVRDATGLLTSAEVSDSQQLNDVANELNLLVESNVAPGLRTMAPDQSLRFVACVEIKSRGAPKPPIAAVPIHAEAL